MAENKFRYTYSAPTEEERREIDGIRRAYRPEEEKTGLDKLRALDKKVRRPAAWAAVLGVVGGLTFGGGMALTLEGGQIAAGIALSLVGVVTAALAFPVRRAVLRRGKRKYGAEIVRLSDELLSGGTVAENETGGKDAVRRLRFLEK